METSREQRAHKRFELKLPALILPASGRYVKEYHLLLTRDISHAGAYFIAMKPCAYDGPVVVEMLIEVASDCDRYICLYMTTTGAIVRREDTGLAVSFDQNSRLVPFTQHQYPHPEH